MIFFSTKMMKLPIWSKMHKRRIIIWTGSHFPHNVTTNTIIKISSWLGHTIQTTSEQYQILIFYAIHLCNLIVITFDYLICENLLFQTLDFSYWNRKMTFIESCYNFKMFNEHETQQLCSVNRLISLYYRFNKCLLKLFTL